MPAPPCPDHDTLTAFAVGELHGPLFERVADHVAACAACGAALDACDASSNTFVAQFRALSDRSLPPAPEVARELIDAAIAAAGEDPGATRCELTVDLGRRMARCLDEGPQRLGRFELLEQIGSGSFGYVFRARDTRLDRIVALKIERASHFDSVERERFQREARSAAQLVHPNIVPIYETGCSEEGAWYLVTELVEGRTLERWMREETCTPRQAAQLTATIARALQYAHARGVIHRDVKPSNVMIDRAGQPHVMDFGLAKRETGEVTVTADGEVMGTPAYMSPEQASGDSHNVDARSDVFSLGVILYELLTGDRPFQGNRRMLMLQLLEEEPRPPRRLDDRVPRALETICLKAMEKAPPRRYASAGALSDDLDRYLRGDPIQARPAGIARRLSSWCRRNPLAASLLLAVTLGSTAGMVYLSRLSRTFVEDTALSSAGMQAEMLEEMNTFYSEIVGQLHESGVEITHEYAGRAGAAPLPATFTIEAGRRISGSKSGMQVRLYSDHPFPWRRDGGPRDQFERDALIALRVDPQHPYYRFTETDGRPALRFATARVMQPSCITCHNTRSDSPKRDWQVGDVRGVLEIIRPLHKDIARVRGGLRGSFILVGAISALLLSSAVAAILVGGARQRRAHPDAAA